MLTDQTKLKILTFVSQRHYKKVKEESMELKNYLQYIYAKWDYTKNKDSSADQETIRPMPQTEKWIKDLIMRMHLNGQ